MGQKINRTLFDKHLEDNVKFILYMFMMKLIGTEIYKKHESSAEQNL